MLVLVRLSTERKHSHARHTTFPRAKHTQNDHFVSYVRFNAILRVLMSCRGYIMTYKHSCTRKTVGTEPWRGQKGSQRRPYLLHEPPYHHSSLCSVSFFFGSFFLRRERRRSVYFKYQKKYFNSSELGVLSTTANSNPGSVDTGTGCAVREQQKQDFYQNQDPVPSYS